ncbi:MAG TPA: AraC family transcriptional regulator [Sediminibacterium sp.]|uniref:helix-turn-helix domain-containing protein n=1 Tax=Sediminibacterium sp. TaxID=1917865 RepID=UPI0008BBC885|nr:AraC family transcriptional regulator [Sediminibacterium sp.]OHC85907.1 MAG: hypothetical protein A2472_09280 [Sphingobacteriia bacterium RIFOXYC2_FULL_35_18]OHC87442.1 MAG: hypothetical protein A2546_05435 [Sphingobacteriia bacterium RIFOXYD2_FULL_35_12]HLD52424.1 AraC family transcriptional regulator [Sediminibacterium sp.]
MELIPESNQKEIITKGNAVLSSSKNSKINGFKSFFKEYISFSHSCQYYLSPHFDIYIYQLENKEAIQVFLQSASCKWLLFYLDTGNIQLINLNDKNFELLEKSSFFASMQVVGNAIKMTIGKGQYSFVCCKLKSGSESILIHYYTTLLNNVDENPILIDSLDSKSQREWEKIFEPIDLVELLPSKLNSLVQLILSNFCFIHKSRKLFSSQTESDLIAQKIHSIKNLIDCYPFKRHTLYGLSTKFNLGIRIIKLHFKQLFNKSVFQYCIEKRIEYAIYLLENHLDYSIKKVALICGFRKTQHFIRQFQQKFGLSPGQYRNKILIKR